jgi:hypothetical protein
MDSLYIEKNYAVILPLGLLCFCFGVSKSADKLTYVVFCPYQWVEGEWNFRAVLMSWIFATWQFLLCSVVAVTNTWCLIPQLFMRRSANSLVITRVATLTLVCYSHLEELRRNTCGSNWFLEFRESRFYVQVAFQPVVSVVYFMLISSVNAVVICVPYDTCP